MTVAAEPADDAPLRDRLKLAVEWLAAPEREGRGPGTKGVDQAADWVAEQLAAIGLEPVVSGVPGGAAATPFQRFAMTLDAKLGPADANTAELVGPPGENGVPRTIPLSLGKDFTPLAAGGSGKVRPAACLRRLRHHRPCGTLRRLRAARGQRGGRFRQGGRRRGAATGTAEGQPSQRVRRQPGVAVCGAGPQGGQCLGARGRGHHLLQRRRCRWRLADGLHPRR
jgi:hypothetical protein